MGYYKMGIIGGYEVEEDEGNEEMNEATGRAEKKPTEEEKEIDRTREEILDLDIRNPNIEKKENDDMEMPPDMH